MADIESLTIEVLKQIRDGVFEVKAEVAGVKDGLTSVQAEVATVRDEVAGLRVEMRKDLGELKATMAQVSRINDETLRFSLQDAGRIDALEGRVRSLESEMSDLRDREP